MLAKVNLIFHQRSNFAPQYVRSCPETLQVTIINYEQYLLESSTDLWVGCIAVEREDAVDSTRAMVALAMMIVAAAMQQ